MTKNISFETGISQASKNQDLLRFFSLFFNCGGQGSFEDGENFTLLFRFHSFIQKQSEDQQRQSSKEIQGQCRQDKTTTSITLRLHSLKFNFWKTFLFVCVLGLVHKFGHRTPEPAHLRCLSKKRYRGLK